MELRLSTDPETRRQISRLEDDDRPLLVVDVDEVVLEFVRPFMRYLDQRGYYLNTDSFRLNGNIISRNTSKPATNEIVEEMIDGLFRDQENWQSLVQGAADALNMLGREAAIIMLTAMPHRHFAQRRNLLDRHGLHFPLLTTEAAKGPAIQSLRRHSGKPVAFVDDIPHNLISVQDHVPDAALFHLMSFEPFKTVMPQLPEGVTEAATWKEAEPLIAKALKLSG